jgi:hypothetical protein
VEGLDVWEGGKALGDSSDGRSRGSLLSPPERKRSRVCGRPRGWVGVRRFHSNFWESRQRRCDQSESREGNKLCK